MIKIEAFSEFISGLSNGFMPIISSLPKEQYALIDLSITNKELNTVDISCARSFEQYIRKFLEVNDAQVAYGGYNEKRGIYKRSTHFNQQDVNKERNIHLGIDLWCNANTAVLSPLCGKIHSFNNNDNYGDYGPTIILEHQYDDVVFYTLYGHLTIDSLSKTMIGEEISVGDTIGYLGDADVNGEYAPHLHFQIIKDIQGNIGDYPGVSNKSDIAFYLQNCPDPNLLLKIY
ncbi:peptidoglycan DD-metalloendopeptidase family protein [Aquimarina pacifica]|uniref:peptidoglycan DD-metalloendopeptidase family protein n=1 Tax=Aquimarina pacifica TaxID=1296415 RepID=UPI0004B95908|nr:peptidoglycan DD-metalloendopeptidase family protein [Aquimarina pacifica]